MQRKLVESESTFQDKDSQIQESLSTIEEWQKAYEALGKELQEAKVRNTCNAHSMQSTLEHEQTNGTTGQS